MNLNDFSKWLQYNRVKNLRGSEYFPYPLYMYVCVYILYGQQNLKTNIYIYIYILVFKFCCPYPYFLVV